MIWHTIMTGSIERVDYIAECTDTTVPVESINQYVLF